MYEIQVKDKHRKSDEFKIDQFMTGGKKFTDFKEAQRIKKSLQKMTTSLIYKVVKKQP